MSSLPTLYLYANTDNTELVKLYESSIDAHNNHVQNDPFPNSGFDLFIPETHILDAREDMHGTLVDLQVKCEMSKKGKPLAYYLYPRSSLSKTPLMLSHSAGIIDSGYRGFIKASLRNLGKSAYTVEHGTRLVQIVHPKMKPFLVTLVRHDTELSSTTRGTGGFGSTGK